MPSGRVILQCQLPGWLSLARKEQEITSPSVCLNMKKHMAISLRCGWGITWGPVELYQDCSLRSASLCCLVTEDLLLRLLIAAALTSETILSEFPWGVHPKPNGGEFPRIRRWEENVTAILWNIFYIEPSCGWELSAFTFPDTSWENRSCVLPLRIPALPPG